jgi:LPXTG-site transpeptidase (sortase) family protein
MTFAATSRPFKKAFTSFLIIFLSLILILQAQPVRAENGDGAEFEQIVQISPEINKKFVPVSIPTGGTSRLTVYIYNPNEYALSNVSFTDDLDKLQTGIIIADPPQASSTCGGTIIASAGTSTFSLTGGHVDAKVGPVNGSCQVAVNVTSFETGNLDNEFVAGDLRAEYTPPEGETLHFENTSGVTETLNVVTLTDPYVYKYFSPDNIWVGQETRVQLRVYNRDTTYALHDVSITDDLPAGLVISDPSKSYTTNCGSEAEVISEVGGTSATLQNAEISANTSCYVYFYAKSDTEGSYTNTMPSNSLSTYEGVTNINSHQDNLTVRGLQIDKHFVASSILAGEDTTTVTFTITNPYTQTLTGANLIDDMSTTDLVFVPDTISTTCETVEAPASLVLSGDNQILTFSAGTIPAGTENDGTVTPGTCTITATVTAPGNSGGGTMYNRLYEGDLTTDQGIDNQYDEYDSIYVNPQSIGVSKYFSPTRFELGGETRVSIQLNNPTSTDITNVNLTDELPAGLVVAETPDVASSCGGTVTTGTNTITLTNGSISANSSCTFSALITTDVGASATTYRNTIPANSITGSGITNLNSTYRDVYVYPVGLGAILSKTFDDGNAAQPTGTAVRVILRLYAPEDKDLSGVTLTDNLPTDMVLASPPNYSLSGCGTDASITGAAGDSSFSLVDAAITAGSQCRIYIDVTSENPGSYTNTILPTDLTNGQNQTFPSNVEDTMRFSDYLISKTFSPDIITWGGRSVLTITLENADERPMTNVWLQDRLSTMGSNEFQVADDPDVSTTCGGTVTANAGEGTITLNGGNIPGRVGSVNGTCTISVTIKANSNAGTSDNTITTSDSSGTVTGAPEITNPRYSTTDRLYIRDMSLEMVKSFDPSSVAGGSSSRLTILLINPNTDVPIPEISFTDTMPAGMKVSLPMDIDTSTCGGDVVVAPDHQSFSYSGGYLAAGRRCTISINATIRVNGNLINTIPSGAVSSFIGVSNEDPASSTLTNLPGVSVRKYFTPDRILAESDEYSVLTIELTNTSNAAVPNLGLVDTFPTGLIIVDEPTGASPNTCGGTFTATVGAGSVQLSGGYLAGVQDPDDPQPESCTLTVAVKAEARDSYRNVIPEGAITSSDEGVTNPDPSEDTLEVYGTPDMQIVKSVVWSGPYTEGSTINYELEVTNTGDMNLNDVQVTDAGVGAVLGACDPALGSTLTPGDVMICSASHVVTADDMTAGQYTNTATADSDRTDPVTDEETVPLTGGPAMSIKKILTSVGPYVVGSEINFSIKVNNIGALNLTNVQVTEDTPGVVLENCAPVQGSTLSVGSSMTCYASYIVTQDDLDVGTFTNVATADSDTDGIDPISDDVSLQLAQYPSMAVYKFETSNGPYAVGDTVTFDVVTKNTGNISLTNVVVTDPGTEQALGPCTLNEDPTLVPLPAELGVGDILYCEAYHEVTQADIDNGEYSNTATSDSDQTDEESGTAVVQMVQIPLVQLTKVGTLHQDVVAPDTRVDAGDTITYVFTVENIGNVTLHDITITDEVAGVQISGGSIATLAPGTSNNSTLTGTYYLTQADVDAGDFENNATVHAKDPNGATVTDSDTDSKSFTAVPGISLTKTGTLALDTVEPDERADVGDVISYVFTVENTGNVTLTNVTITDDDATITGDPITLEPGETDTVTFTGEYALEQAAINAGTFTNEATVTGTTPSDTEVSDSDTDTQLIERVPGITLEKLGSVVMDIVEPDGQADVGDEIHYTFIVTNTGNVTLTNIVVEDTTVTVEPKSTTDLQPGDSITGVQVSSTSPGGLVTLSGNPIVSLDSGMSDSTKITGKVILTQEMIDAGVVHNMATVTATAPDNSEVTASDDATVTLAAEPEITLTKTGTLNDDVVDPSGQVNVGDTITYVFTITNTGNVTVHELSVEDAGVTLSGSPVTVSLAPGQSNNTITGTHILTQDEIDSGSYDNTATGKALTPGDEEVTDDDTESIELEGVPSITLEKTGTFADDVVPPAGVVNAGDQIKYQFTVENTGNVTLSNVTVTDADADVVLTGCDIGTLAVGATDSTSCTGVYTVTQDDIYYGGFVNNATVDADDPEGGPVTDSDDDSLQIDIEGELGVAKTVSSAPVEMSTGVWQFTYRIELTNMGNTSLSTLQIEDDLTAVFPSPNVFSVIDVSSTDFALNSLYNGISGAGGDINLLEADINSLDVGESGSLTITVELVPVDAGPFLNTAVSSGITPSEDFVEDDSQNGVDPDPDEDYDPKNNDEPTPLEFGTDMFNPPMGIKTYTNAGQPKLEWSITWINNSNIVPIETEMSDPIPSGATFMNDGVSSGYPMPAGDQPEGSTASGVRCTVDPLSTQSSTTYCYYEGPTLEYPRGRVIWVGTLGPDLGASTAEQAVNEVTIDFAVRVSGGTLRMQNVATLGVDLDGSGSIDETEVEVVSSSRSWEAEELPQTGFAPGRLTVLPTQPLDLAYDPTYVTLSIPDINVSASVTTVPFRNGAWDVTWLGNEVGYLEGSAYPTWNGNTVLTAHNTTAYNEAGLFADLSQLRYGDQFTIHAYGQTYTYEVREKLVVSQSNLSAAFKEQRLDWVTLMTCADFSEADGEYVNRLLVRAVLISVSQ